MNRSVRGVATSLALGFALSFAARALWWVERPAVPVLMVCSIIVYLASIAVVVLLRSEASVRAPLPAVFVALVAASTVPLLAGLSMHAPDRTAPFATWYIGAIGLLAVVCIVRRRFLVGWTALAILIAISCWSLGAATALQLGLVGSIMWVVVAQVLVLFWERAVQDTERLTGIQRAVSAWHATQQVRQKERRVRARYALSVAGPVLSRTVAAHGILTPEERLQARLAEGRLRDELRGASLLNDAVRSAIEEARRRGVSVTVFDEGGLDDLDDDRRAAIRDELAAVVQGAESGRLIIRAAGDPIIAVTVVGRTGSGDSSEEDSVSLWHEIPRSAPVL
ncbi:hypothetical protein ACWGJP_00375 [Microbacterium sp. NPDC055903]